MHRRQRWPFVFLFFVLFLVLSARSFAIPAFSRLYGTSCTTCHLDFPKLNDFGKAFKDAGFKFPKDDESFMKIPPVMLGAPANKELFPHTVWPGTLPGVPAIGLRYNHFFQYVSTNANNFNTQYPTDPTQQQYVPRTDFQSGLFSIFTAGNFGSDIAFWVDDDISVNGANANGGLGDGYLRFVNVSRFLKLPTDSLNVRFGQFELDLPFSQARSWNLSGWDIYSQPNIGAAGIQNVNNSFALENAAQGIEISGGHHYGGYEYSVAIVNQNTGGTPSSGVNVPPVVAFTSDSNFKDLYARFQYRFNLERDPASRNSIQAAGASGPRDHTYLSLGTLYFYGRSVQRFAGEDSSGNSILLSAHEPFYRVGGDFSFNYRTFNLFGQFLYGRDQNLLPIMATGATLPSGFAPGSAAHFSGGFLEADYLIYPWMMAIMRWDRVNSWADEFNGVGTTLNNPGGAPYFSAYSSVRNRFTPGIQFLIHANIKTSFEYQVRPQQVVYAPNTNIALTGPFRTNTAVAGLEFVY
jgi:hypothetical protein